MMKVAKVDCSFGIVPLRLAGSQWHYLLVQHRAGHWGFPKGHADGGEDALAAAKREFLEETGITQYRLYPDYRFEERYLCLKKGNLVEKTVVYFLALTAETDVTLPANELRAYAWQPFAETVRRLTFDEGKRLCRDVQQLVHDQERDLQEAAIALAAGHHRPAGDVP